MNLRYRHFAPRRGRRLSLVSQPQAILPRSRQPDLSSARSFEMLEAKPYALTGRRVRGLLGSGLRGVLGASAPGEDGQTAAQTVQQWLPVAKTLFDRDAYESVEVLKAKINNQTEMMRWAPEPLKTVYRNNIEVLKAKLRAAQHAKSIEREGEQAQRTWRIFGWTLTSTGVVVGAAAAAALLSIASKNRRAP